jgi:hypothetical protein
MKQAQSRSETPRVHGLSRVEKLVQHSVRQELKLKALTAYCYRLAVRIRELEKICALVR